jgi:hypothetical protein
VRKFLVALALTVAGAGALTGCGIHLGPYAAVVDGSTISQQTLNSSLESIASNHDYLCSVTNGNPSAIATTGAGTGTYDIQFTDFVLRHLVWAHLAADEVTREHATLTSFVLPIADQQVTSSLGSAVQGCSGSGASILGQLAPDYRNALVTLNGSLDVLSARREGITLTHDGLTRYADAHPEDAQLVCTSYVQAATPASAARLVEAVKKGTPFATEAAKLTGSPPQAVPCMPIGQFPSQIASALANLRTGQVSQPVTFQQATYVFELGSRQAATPEQLLQTIIGSLQNQFSAVLAEMERSGQVQLDPAYGSWSVVSSGPILAPPSPPAKFLPSPDAIRSQPGAPATSAPSGTTGG